jgi:hypothetical protein
MSLDGGWRKRLRAVDLFAFAEEAEDLASTRSCCAHGSHAVPSLGVELFADLLEGRPPVAPGQRYGEADPGEL